LKNKRRDKFSDEFHQIFKAQKISTVFILFYKTEMEGILANPLLHSSQNQTRTHAKRRSRPISIMNIDAKILNKIMANGI
jgi:hypothetical protein